MFKTKKVLMFSALLLILLTIGMVSASENLTDEMTLNGQSSHAIETPIHEKIQSIESESSHTIQNFSDKFDSKIETDNVIAYYKEDYQLLSYLKNNNGKPIANKKVSIFINDKTYSKITDNSGKVVLKLNLKPGVYTATIKFDGDDNYTASSANTLVNVKKSSLVITADDYKTYFESDFFFKAKVFNKITKKPVKNVKVAFKVYHNNKYKVYYGVSDENGVAKLKKNLNVGSYKVVVLIKKDKFIKAKKTKATLTIKQTAEMGCSSLYLQVNKNEAVAGFRRDATNAKTLHIVKYKLNGKWAVKQYKTNSYFFHSLTTADGWMAGTGGLDNPTINHAIERLAGKMAKSGKIKQSYLKKIQDYERQLKLGHFSIKAPNGKYAIVWGSGIIHGKLKPGEYIDAPNAKSLFRHGTWDKYSNNPAKAAIKVAASDSFGVNRRDATAFHWKATTDEGKTTSSLKVYAANDNGHLVGRSTGHLIDHIKFNGKFISKYSLPKTPSSKFLGTINFGSIDRLIKTQTTVNAPKLTKGLNDTKSFDITVINKKNKSPIKNLKVIINVDKKIFTVKTDSKGIAHFDAMSLDKGKHDVVIYSGSDKYYVSAKSTIKII